MTGINNFYSAISAQSIPYHFLQCSFETICKGLQDFFRAPHCEISVLRQASVHFLKLLLNKNQSFIFSVSYSWVTKQFWPKRELYSEVTTLAVPPSYAFSVDILSIPSLLRERFFCFHFKVASANILIFLQRLSEQI